jgi:indole-3-glycerol phosphate synthase
VILDEIVAHKRAQHASREPADLDRYWAAIARLPPVRPFVLRAGATHPAVIAEHKRASPSAGSIRPGSFVAEIAREYEAAGASALSVLTDERFFAGAPVDVSLAHGSVALPIVRKDFLLDERDLLESRMLSADAALLIVRLLDEKTLAHLIDVGRRAGLSLLVEAHSDDEIRAARAAGAEIIGVNHRDLDTLRIDLALSARARTVAGDGVTLVGESGLSTPADLREMRARGLDAVLVGEALMRAPSPGTALRELLS